MSNNSNTVFNVPKELNNSNTVFNLPNSNPKRYQHTISQYSNGSNSSRASPVPYPSNSNSTNSMNSTNSLPTFRFKSLTQKKQPARNRSLRIEGLNKYHMYANYKNDPKIHEIKIKYEIDTHIIKLKNIQTKFNEYDKYIIDTISRFKKKIAGINKIIDSLKKNEDMNDKIFKLTIQKFNINQIIDLLKKEEAYITTKNKDINDTIQFLESGLIANLTNDEYKLLHNEDVTLILDISKKLQNFNKFHIKTNAVYNSMSNIETLINKQRHYKGVNEHGKRMSKKRNNIRTARLAAARLNYGYNNNTQKKINEALKKLNPKSN